MQSILDARKRAVVDAEAIMNAANALDKHYSLQAKTETKSLLLSAKGLGAVFATGAVKGAFSTDAMTMSKLSTIVAKTTLSRWLADIS